AVVAVVVGTDRTWGGLRVPWQGRLCTLATWLGPGHHGGFVAPATGGGYCAGHHGARVAARRVGPSCRVGTVGDPARDRAGWARRRGVLVRPRGELPDVEDLGRDATPCQKRGVVGSARQSGAAGDVPHRRTNTVRSRVDGRPAVGGARTGEHRMVAVAV